MKSTTGKPINRLNLLSRESLLKANSELIERLQDRLRAKRFRPQEGDGIKLAYMRVFLQALQVQNAILKDQEIEDLKQRLEVLEAMQAGNLAAIEDPVYNSNIESLAPRNISEF
jgi:hypothetical protein